MLEIFITFLRLGLIGFGGPIALVSLIENEVCHNKKWIDYDKFTLIFSICKLLPGPLAVQVAICCGYQRGKRIGGLIAGISFLLPALIMIIVLGILYQHNLNTQSPHLSLIFAYMQNATIAVILLTLWSLAKLYIKNITSALICLICLGLIYVVPNYEPLLIISFGFLGILIYKITLHDLYYFPSVMLANIPKIFTTNSDLVYSKLINLFIICIKAGEFSFGTGLAILPLLHADMVTHFAWLNERQFMDGITLGQITPGPTTVSIVFFGFLIAGYKGLLVSLFGFYIPPLFNSLLIIPVFWDKLTSSSYLKVFTAWAFPAVIGGIASATIKLSHDAYIHYQYILAILFALFFLQRKLLPVWAIIPLYGIIGYLVSYF
ncbi:MAG: hypothetical protein RLZZ293_635 [Pseudomonadota bacterium]|jgi:chromate transporter